VQNHVHIFSSQLTSTVQYFQRIMIYDLRTLYAPCMSTPLPRRDHRLI